jgi:hypothetical protein
MTETECSRRCGYYSNDGDLADHEAREHATHAYPEPRFTATRSELVDAIASCSVERVAVVRGVAMIEAESMADAIIEALRQPSPDAEGTAS